MDTFLGVITKLDYFWGSFLCIYRSLLGSMYRTGIFLLVAHLLLLLLFYCFFVVVVFFVFFGGGG